MQKKRKRGFFALTAVAVMCSCSLTAFAQEPKLQVTNEEINMYEAGCTGWVQYSASSPWCKSLVCGPYTGVAGMVQTVKYKDTGCKYGTNYKTEYPLVKCKC